jgi:uncharacterized protein YecT (DUF1311 family)
MIHAFLSFRSLNLQFTLFTVALSVFSVSPSFAQTQNDINVEARTKDEKVRKEISQETRKLCSEESSIKGLRAKLDETQELWKNFCDAHVDSIFPLDKSNDPGTQYGSIYGLCVWTDHEELDSWRLKELKQWHKATAATDSAQAEKAYNDADKKLNAVYVKVIKSPAKSQASFITNLRKAETAWIAFRDADAEAFELCHKSAPGTKFSKMTELTNERIKQLDKWLTGAEEGDTCAGSYPIK